MQFQLSNDFPHTFLNGQFMHHTISIIIIIITMSIVNGVLSCDMLHFNVSLFLLQVVKLLPNYFCKRQWYL